MLYPRPGATRDIVDSLLSQNYNGGLYGRNNYTGMGGGPAGQGDFGGCRSGGLGGMQGDLGGRLGGMGGMGGMGMGGIAMGMGHDDLLGGPLGRRGNFPPGPRSPLDSPMNLPYPGIDPHSRLHPGSPQASHLGRQPLMSGALPHGSRSRLPLHSPSMSSIFDPYRMDRPRMPYGPEAMAGRRPSNYRAPYVEDYESEMEADMMNEAMMQHMYGVQGGMGDGYFGMDGGYGYGGGMGGMGGMGMGGRMG